MSRPILSAITATHNDGPYIKEAVDSILTQTYNDFEYIIVDDGSTDETFKVLSSINDKRVRVLKNEVQKGRGAATNRALEQAQGKYVALMDGDDISHPERFQIQMDYLKANPDISYFGTGAQLIQKKDGEFIRNETKPFSNGAIRWMLFHKSPIIHATSIGHRDLINKVGKYDETLVRCQDIDLMRKISKVGNLANLPQVLYTYRVRNGENQIEMEKSAKPYAKHVHTVYMRDFLPKEFDADLLSFIWSVRYPIHDDLPNTNKDEIIFSAVAALFALYTEFRKRYKLSPEEIKYIHEDLLGWIGKIANKSENYTTLLDVLLREENLTNLKRNNSLIKAWIKSVFR